MVIRNRAGALKSNMSAQCRWHVAPSITRGDFLKLYRERMHLFHSWAFDTVKLDDFMGKVETKLAQTRTVSGFGWHWESAAVRTTWRLLGQIGYPTLKQLRALPLT